MSSRFRLLDRPEYQEPLTRDDLLALASAGVISKGDICADTETGANRTVAELIAGFSAGAAGRRARVNRPSYQEIRADHNLSPVNETGNEEEFEADEDDDWEEDELEDGEETADDDREKLVLRRHPSWLCYWKPLLLALALTIAAPLAAPVDILLAAAGFGCAALIFIITVLARASREYLVSDERVEVIWGIVSRSSKEVRIRDIRAIDVTETLVSGMLGIGTVDFSSAGNSGVEVAFRFVRGPHRIKELVRRLQRKNAP
jgi:hypothetical protein